MNDVVDTADTSDTADPSVAVTEEVEVGEDASKYGEFISSYFAWISLAKQKERAEHLEEVTKENNKNK